MNPKIEKITSEIDKLRTKITSSQNRLRELERQKTELENADIVAAVRGVEIAPDELAAFVQMFKEKQQGGIVPNLDTTATDIVSETAETTGKGGKPAKITEMEDDSLDEN